LVGAIIGVRTIGMWIVVILTPLSITSVSIQREKAASAAFEAT
jgi:DMSO/TMAO reductase YedYZ heme-binding membrane subunit